MDYAEHTEDVALSNITPLHEVRDAAKFAGIAQSMAVNGWQGRPLLVVSDGNGAYVAMTGSHRYAAARDAGLKTAPCVVIPAGERVFVNWRGDVVEWCEEYIDGIRLCDDDERLAALRAAGLDVAASLVADEIEAAS